MSNYQPKPQQPYYPSGGAPIQPSNTNSKALVALVLSIVGFFASFLFSIAGLVLGYQARAEIARSGQEGANTAKWAIILGWVSLAWGALWGIILLVFFVIVVILGAHGAATSECITNVATASCN